MTGFNLVMRSVLHNASRIGYGWPVVTVTRQIRAPDFSFVVANERIQRTSIGVNPRMIHGFRAVHAQSVKLTAVIRARNGSVAAGVGQTIVASHSLGASTLRTLRYGDDRTVAYPSTICPKRL